MDKLNAVRDRDSFIEFVHELAHAFRRHGETWENGRVDLYLDALAAWVADMDGYYTGKGLPVPAAPDWKNVADMLMAASIYE